MPHTSAAHAAHAAPTTATSTSQGPFGHDAATTVAGMYGGAQPGYGARSGGVSASVNAGGQMAIQQQMAQMAQMAQLAQQQAAMYQLYGVQQQAAAQAGPGQASGRGLGLGPGQARPAAGQQMPAGWGYGGMYGANAMAGMPFGAMGSQMPGAMGGQLGGAQTSGAAMTPGVAQASAAGLSHMPLAYTLAFMRRFANDGGRSAATAGHGAEVGMPFGVPFMGSAAGATDGFRKRKRASQACLRCRRRKQRCSGSQPCNLCMRAGVACEFSAVSDRRRRRRSGSSTSGSKAPAAKPDAEENGVIGSSEQSELWEFLSSPMLVPLVDVPALKELVASPKAWARGSGNTAAQSVILASVATAVSRTRGAASAKPYFFRARQQLAASMADTPGVWTLYAAVQMVLFADDVMSDPVLAAGLRSFITSVVTSVSDHDAKLRFALSFALARSGSGEALPATPWPEDDPDAYLGSTLGQMTRVLLKHAAGSCSRKDYAVATEEVLEKTAQAEADSSEKRSVVVTSFVRGVRVLAELAAADAAAGARSDSEAERPVAAIELARKAWHQTKHVFACSPLSVEYAALGYAIASAFCDAGEADSDATRAMPLITATVQASSRCFPGIRAIASSMADAGTPVAASVAAAVRAAAADGDESKESTAVAAGGGSDGPAAKSAAATGANGHAAGGAKGGATDGAKAKTAGAAAPTAPGHGGGASDDAAVKAATSAVEAAKGAIAGDGANEAAMKAAAAKRAGYAPGRFPPSYGGGDMGQRFGFYGSMYQGRGDGGAPFMMPPPNAHGSSQPYYAVGPSGQQSQGHPGAGYPRR